MDGGDFFPEKKILGPGVGAGAVPGGDGPVVAHLVGPAVAGGAAAAIKTVSMPPVVGVPGGVAGLENDVVGACVVADHKRDMILGGAGNQVGDIDP